MTDTIAMPMFSAKEHSGLHLVVMTPHQEEIRQPFGIEGFYRSYEEFGESGDLPILLQRLWLNYHIEPVGDETSVWAELEVVKRRPTADYVGPRYALSLVDPDDPSETLWEIVLIGDTRAVVKAV